MDKTIGDYVREARSATGKSQVETARLAGISQPYFSEIENGKEPPFRVLRRIASVLGVSPRELIPEE